MRRALRDIFINPENMTQRVVSFLSCAGLYVVVGTLAASLIAWTLFLIASAGTVLVMLASQIDGSLASLFAFLGTIGISFVFFLFVAAAGYLFAPFFGAIVGWKAAIAISIVIACFWSRPNLRRYVLWLSPVVGALGGMLVSHHPALRNGQIAVISHFPPDSAEQVAIHLGIAASSALSAFLTTWIIWFWVQPSPD